MTVFVYRPGHPQANKRGMVDKRIAGPPPGVPVVHGRGPYIISDIEPYQSTVTGEVIGGRAQHREHLREHDCIELGTEKAKPKTPEPLPDPKADLAEAMEMVKGGYRPAPIDTYNEKEFET